MEKPKVLIENNTKLSYWNIGKFIDNYLDVYFSIGTNKTKFYQQYNMDIVQFIVSKKDNVFTFKVEYEQL